MRLTLQQAGDLVGKSKSTIYRSIKKGHISAEYGIDGVYYVETAELLRVFPAKRVMTQDVTHHATVAEVDETTVKAAVLEAKVEMMAAQSERDQETIADLRKRLDRAEDRILALTAPQPEQVASKRKWWSWR